jgi:hypothetical protein
MPTVRLRLKQHRQKWVNGGLFVLLLALIVSVTTVYIIHDRNFHWWIDWWYRTIQLAQEFRLSPLAAIEQLQSSLREERNGLYILPLLPFVWVGGESRLVYTIGLALVYWLPFCLVMGALATQVIRAPARPVFWSTAFLTLLMPVNWMPTFLGIPDTGAALLIGLATLLYLQDIRLKQIWRIVAIGGLLAGAVLLRRHFSYGGMALLGAITLQGVGLAWIETEGKRSALTLALGKFGLKVMGIGLTIVAVMSLVAWEFTYHAIARDYRSLYASWSLPLSDTIARYAGFYGWATWLLGLLGLAIGLSTHTLIWHKTLPQLGAGGIALLIWVGGLRYGNVFYALHITPIMVIGLSACLWSLVKLRWRWLRQLLLASAIAYIVANWLMGLLPIGALPLPGRSLFAFNMPPLVRTDTPELLRLVNYLQSVAPIGQPIYVAGYQRLQLTASLIKAVEQVQNSRSGSRLNLLSAPQVDSQDFYPLQPLLQAQYVVVPTPLLAYPGDPAHVPVMGEWILPQETDVVQVVLNAFAQQQGIAQDFERSPVEFQLDFGTTVRVYRRVRPTALETAIQTFHAMRQQIGDRPGGQRDWLSLGSTAKLTQVSKNQDGTYRIVSFPGDRLLPTSLTERLFSFDRQLFDNSATFLYVGKLADTVTIAGWLTFWTPPCQGAKLRLLVVNPQGLVQFSLELTTGSVELTRWQRSIAAAPDNLLILQILSAEPSTPDWNYCTVDVNNLVVVPARP